jgi:hypothetical protein
MQSQTPREGEELGVGAWVLFWLQLGILALLALAGAFVAADTGPGDYASGLTLAFASLALAALRIKTRFDGEPPGWAGFLLVDDWTNLIAVIVVFAVVALIGIFVAAGLGHGALYAGGIALACASALAVLLSLKHVFDTMERRR